VFTRPSAPRPSEALSARPGPTTSSSPRIPPGLVRWPVNRPSRSRPDRLLISPTTISRGLGKRRSRRRDGAATAVQDSPPHGTAGRPGPRHGISSAAACPDRRLC
jgi:hypothetical protein